MSRQRQSLWAFWAGLVDGYRGLGTGITYDGDPESPRSRAYDHGRNVGEAIPWK